MKQNNFRPIGLWISGIGGLSFTVALAKGGFSLFGAKLNTPPGNGWIYLGIGIALFWMGAFIYSPTEQRNRDAEAIRRGGTPTDFMMETLEKDKKAE